MSSRGEHNNGRGGKTAEASTTVSSTIDSLVGA